MTVFLRQSKPLQYVKNKSSLNFKMSVTRIHRYVC